MDFLYAWSAPYPASSHPLRELSRFIDTEIRGVSLMITLIQIRTHSSGLILLALHRFHEITIFIETLLVDFLVMWYGVAQSL